MIEQLKALIPDYICDMPGAAFLSGRSAFTNPAAPVLFMGLNPGGDPEDGTRNHAQTVSESIDDFWGEQAPDDYSAYYNAAWGKRRNSGNFYPPGGAPKQRRVRHLYDNLGMDIRHIPAINFVFPRSPRWAWLKERYDVDVMIADHMPLHRRLIEGLGIRTIIVAGAPADNIIRRVFGADRHIATGETDTRKPVKMTAYENAEGLRVLRLPHWSMHDWSAEHSDPTEFVAEFGILSW